jgi:hypothetical protein
VKGHSGRGIIPFNIILKFSSFYNSATVLTHMPSQSLLPFIVYDLATV